MNRKKWAGKRDLRTLLWTLNKVKKAMKIRVENDGGLKELLVFFKKD